MARATKFNAERAAVILVEAAYKGEKQAAKDWGITTRSLRNWRRRLDSDESFSAIFRHKKELAEKDWAQDAPLTIRAAMAFIRRASQSESQDPEMVHAVAGAMKLLADVTLTKQVLDARVAHANRPAN